MNPYESTPNSQIQIPNLKSCLDPIWSSARIQVWSEHGPKWLHTWLEGIWPHVEHIPASQQHPSSIPALTVFSEWNMVRPICDTKFPNKSGTTCENHRKSVRCPIRISPELRKQRFLQLCDAPGQDVFFVNPLRGRIGRQHRSIEGLQIVIGVAVVVSH